MRTDDRTKYSIASAIEVFTSDDDNEATAMVARICKASERHVDPTLSPSAQAEQVYQNMDLIYRVQALIGNRQVSAERVATIIQQMG